MLFFLRNNGYLGLERTPFFHGLKNRAASLKEKIRLALTDVTRAQMLAEAATNRNFCIPDTRTMASISQAAFEIEDFWRIVEVLHKRLSRFNKKHWIKSYKALILLEHLLIHGPKSTAGEFQGDRDVQKLGSFQFKDKLGFDCGLTMREKAKRILELLGNEILLNEERNHARRLVYGIEESGSGRQDSSASLENEIQIDSCSKSGRKRTACVDDFSQQEDPFSSIKNGLTEDNGQTTENQVTRERINEVGARKKIKSAWNSVKYNISHHSPWNVKANAVLAKDVQELRELDDGQLRPLLGSQED